MVLGMFVNDVLRYYEDLGFHALDDFSFPRVKSGGVWHGRLFKMDL